MSDDEIFNVLNDMPQDEGWILNIDPIEFGRRIVKRQQDEIERLRQVCRDAYEVYAGSEGIPMPETAAEAYLYQLLMEMKEEIKRGLK
jgi:hypothetical protein